MNNNLGFEEFNNAVVESIREFLPETFAKADVSLNLVNKNNGVVLTGLVIRSIDSVVTPTIYLNGFYEQFQNGMEFETVLRRIAELRIDNEYNDEFDVGFVTEFERCRDRIVPRLINREANENMLGERPYTAILDLAVTYHIMLGDDGSMSIPITNSLIENWGISVEELHKVSINNLPKVSPSIVKGMNEVLSEMMDMSPDELGLPDDDKLHILSNENKLFGAAALLDEDVMLSIVRRMGSIYILPSSVHEVIFLIADDEMDVDSLRNMVHEVNESEVSVEERLSENVYVFTAEEGLQIA